MERLHGFICSYINDLMTKGAVEMIHLEVSDYCEKCPDFEADVEKRKIVSPRNREWIDTIVRCKHRKRC